MRIQRREVAAIQIVSVALNSRESPIRFMNSTIGATPVRARPGAIRASAAGQFSAQPFRRGRARPRAMCAHLIRGLVFDNKNDYHSQSKNNPFFVRTT